MPVPSLSNTQAQEAGMLILAKITRTSAGGYAEYLEGKAQASELGDYYLKDGERTEAPGRWVQGAREFELDPGDLVTGEQLHALLDVRRPDTGEELRRVGGSGEAVAAIDATFSAPKSVSAVWALADSNLRERIEQAHETAVDRALAYANRQVPMLRRRVGQDAVVHEKALGVVATSWRHTTARAVADQVPDPQLHSHVLLHAAVRRDGKLVAIDSRSWLVHQRELGAAYRSELARELHELGFQIRRGTGRGERYFELSGVPQELLDRWSSRHHQVQAAIGQRIVDRARELQTVVAAGGAAGADAALELDLLEQTGQLSPAQERLVGTVTRTSKTAVTVQDLNEHWRQAALSLGADRGLIEALRHPSRGSVEAAAPSEVLTALTEFDATFPAREARAVALERSAGAPIQAALEQLRELRASDHILPLADGTGTTREHRARERTVVEITERLARARIEPLPAAATVREIDRLDRELAFAGGRLSDEQRTAIRLGCGERLLVVIEGQAGTGKSTTLTAIARAHQASGQQILVVSTAGLAAERLAAELAGRSVTCTAYSTASLSAAIATGYVELTPQTTVIHDEAVLASTREQIRLLAAVESTGARLIEVGDPRQNQPVGAGGLWTQIETAVRNSEARVELTVNQRARAPEDRRDQARFRVGQAELAIRGYATRDRVHLDGEQRRIEDQALEAAHADRTLGRTTLVIAQTSNEHLDELNARAQAIRRQHQQLGHDGIDLPGRPYQLNEGDVIQIRHTIQHPDHGQLRNGTQATVANIDAAEHALNVRLADGTELRLQQDQIAEADLRLAYVQHPFPAQGHTTDTAHVLIAVHPSREGTYVGLTRARDETHIYATDPADRPPETDQLQELADRISRTEPEMPSIRTPLVHDNRIAAETNEASSTHQRNRVDPAIRELASRSPPQPLSRVDDSPEPLDSVANRGANEPTDSDELGLEPTQTPPDVAPDCDLSDDDRQTPEAREPRRRVWPGARNRENLDRTTEQLRGESHGWEP